VTESRRLTALIEREHDMYVAHCPELDIASQGATIEEASGNLREALELFFETASKDEVSRRLEPFDRSFVNLDCLALSLKLDRCPL
jgi:predicted RNase H-like HicB family nuclease